MSDIQIQTQTPGEHGPTEPSALARVLEGSVPEIAASLDAATDEELAQLLALEKQGADRKGVYAAIELERKRRGVEAQVNGTGEVITPVSEAPSASTDYRHLSAAQVDQAKLSQPVLSRDGWVMPKPAANPGA